MLAAHNSSGSDDINLVVEGEKMHGKEEGRQGSIKSFDPLNMKNIKPTEILREICT